MLRVKLQLASEKRGQLEIGEKDFGGVRGRFNQLYGSRHAGGPPAVQFGEEETFYENFGDEYVASIYGWRFCFCFADADGGARAEG